MSEKHRRTGSSIHSHGEAHRIPAQSGARHPVAPHEHLPRWTVTIPTVREMGAVRVHGWQTWVLPAARMLDAARQALTHAASADALRHRRGAAIDISAISVNRWDGGTILDGSW